MIFKKIVSEGLAHNSYFIGSNGVAAIIDPARDVEKYLKIAMDENLKIKYIFETHRNEDYVTGSKELQIYTQAKIVHSGNLDFAYGSEVKENDKFKLGLFELEILETPGHTNESISITVKDKNFPEQVMMVFCGDLLFAGETGRVDLYGPEKTEKQAAKLYNSIHKKILTLDDGVIICPAHGQGSVCGGDISDHEYTTIGYEKNTNKALSEIKNEFIANKVNENHSIPSYFKQMEKYNKEGAPIIGNLPNPKSLTADEIENLNDIQLLDIRKPVSFAGSHIPGSLNIWRDGLPMFAGYFINYKQPIVLIDDFNLNLEAVVKKLIRLGFDNIEGYLGNGFSSWINANKKFETINIWNPQKLKNNLDDNNLLVLDVGDRDSWQKAGHIENAKHIYIGDLADEIERIPIERQIVVYCESGFKTSIATSFLKKYSYKNVINLAGGLSAWKLAEYRIVK